MTFEEEFPSLKGKEACVEFENGDEYETLSIWKSDIQKYCLDKQRVREAIDKVFVIPSPEDSRQISRQIGKSMTVVWMIEQNLQLKKELGL